MVGAKTDNCFKFKCQLKDVHSSTALQPQPRKMPILTDGSQILSLALRSVMARSCWITTLKSVARANACNSELLKVEQYT